MFPLPLLLALLQLLLWQLLYCSFFSLFFLLAFFHFPFLLLFFHLRSLVPPIICSVAVVAIFLAGGLHATATWPLFRRLGGLFIRESLYPRHSQLTSLRPITHFSFLVSIDIFTCRVGVLLATQVAFQLNYLLLLSRSSPSSHTGYRELASAC